MQRNILQKSVKILVFIELTDVASDLYDGLNKLIMYSILGNSTRGIQ